MKAPPITLLLALAAAGCVTIPDSTTPITVQSGKPVAAERVYQRELGTPSLGNSAKVVFLRDAGAPGSYCTHKILVDGRVVFAIRGGEHQTLYLAPGRHLLGLDIEGGVCPALSLRYQTVLSDKSEETYRILIPSLQEGPTVLKIDVATGKPIARFADASQIAGSSSSPGAIAAAPSLSAQHPEAVGTGWRIKFDQSGSNPVVADGVLYVGSADGAVYALDSKTGEMKWRFQTGEGLWSGPNVITVPRGTGTADQMVLGINAAQGQRGAGVRRIDMTPAVENGTVFVGSGDQSFYAIDVATGKEKWSYRAGPGMASANFSPSTRPAAVLKDGTVYFEATSGLYALDALTGKEQWLFHTPHSFDTPKGPLMGDGVVFLTAGKVLYAIDPESGKTRWEWVAGVDSREISERTTAKGLALVAVKERPTLPARPNHATLYAINAADGQVKWAASTETIWGTQALLIADNRIYFCTDTSLLALELETGRRLWSFSAEDIRAPLLADVLHLYLITHKDSLFVPNRTLHALALTTGQEKWSRGLSGNARIGMLHDGVVYAGFHAIDAVTGKESWSFTGTGRESAQLLSGGRVFLASPTVTYIGSTRVDQGYLYAIDAKAGGLDSR
jgi:outer membrane protein assembly factor BamB